MTPITFSFLSSSEQNTKAFAAELAKLLTPPMTLLLQGDLGAGKTTFVQGFVSALTNGQSQRVQSPTFALAKTYDTHPPVHHLDLYRLDEETPFEDIGIEHWIDDQNAFVCIEWPKIWVRPSLQKSLWIDFKNIDTLKRELKLTVYNPQIAALIGSLLEREN